MSRFKLIPYKPDHFDLLEIREREVRTMQIIGHGKERMNALSQMGTCFIMMFDGRVLGAVGWFEFWPGVCELFVLPSIYLPKAGIVFAKAMKKHLHSFEKIKRFRRIQVTAVKDMVHIRWLTWLGFVTEGVLKNYGPNGEDFMMWARCTK